MVAVNRHGSGLRGRLIVVVAGVVFLMSIALVLGGCGDSAKQDSTGSQLDDQSTGASGGISTVGGVGSTGGAASQGNAMVDYPFDQCAVDMTKRYGDEATARKVCSGLQADYGNSQMSQLPVVLPQVETKVGATPLPGSTIPGTGTQPGGTTPGGTSGSGNSGSGGWDSGGIEIVVPAGPNQ